MLRLLPILPKKSLLHPRLDFGKPPSRPSSETSGVEERKKSRKHATHKSDAQWPHSISIKVGGDRTYFNSSGSKPSKDYSSEDDSFLASSAVSDSGTNKIEARKKTDTDNKTPVRKTPAGPPPPPATPWAKIDDQATTLEKALQDVYKAEIERIEQYLNFPTHNSICMRIPESNRIPELSTAILKRIAQNYIIKSYTPPLGPLPPGWFPAIFENTSATEFQGVKEDEKVLLHFNHIEPSPKRSDDEGYLKEFRQTTKIPDNLKKNTRIIYEVVFNPNNPAINTGALRVVDFHLPSSEEWAKYLIHLEPYRKTLQQFNSEFESDKVLLDFVKRTKRWELAPSERDLQHREYRDYPEKVREDVENYAFNIDDTLKHLEPLCAKLCRAPNDSSQDIRRINTQVLDDYEKEERLHRRPLFEPIPFQPVDSKLFHPEIERIFRQSFLKLQQLLNFPLNPHVIIDSDTRFTDNEVVPLLVSDLAKQPNYHVYSTELTTHYPPIVPVIDMWGQKVLDPKPIEDNPKNRAVLVIKGAIPTDSQRVGNSGAYNRLTASIPERIRKQVRLIFQPLLGSFGNTDDPGAFNVLRLPKVNSEEWARIFPHTEAYQAILDAQNCEFASEKVFHEFTKDQARWEKHDDSNETPFQALQNLMNSETEDSVTETWDEEDRSIRHLNALCADIRDDHPDVSQKVFISMDDIRNYEKRNHLPSEEGENLKGPSYEIISPEKKANFPGFDDVIGHDDAVKLIKQNVEKLKTENADHSNFYFPAEGSLCSNAIFIEGPTGSGKTLLAKATANEFPDAPFISALGSTFEATKWGGDNTKLFDQLCAKIDEQVKKHDVVIVSIDEIHVLGKEQSQDEHSYGQSRNSLLVKLFAYMDSIESQGKKVILIGVTSRPWELSATLKGRFFTQLETGYLDSVGVQTMLSKRLAKHRFKQDTIQDIVSNLNIIPGTISGRKIEALAYHCTLDATKDFTPEQKNSAPSELDLTEETMKNAITNAHVGDYVHYGPFTENSQAKQPNTPFEFTAHEIAYDGMDYWGRQTNFRDNSRNMTPPPSRDPDVSVVEFVREGDGVIRKVEKTKPGSSEPALPESPPYTVVHSRQLAGYLSLDEIAGHAETKEELARYVKLFQDPKRVKQIRPTDASLNPKVILFESLMMSGNKNMMFVNAFAKAFPNAPYITANATSFTSTQHMGEARKTFDLLLAEIKTQMRKHETVIVALQDIENFGKRLEPSADNPLSVKDHNGTLRYFSDHIKNDYPDRNVIILLTTRKPSEVDTEVYNNIINKVKLPFLKKDDIKKILAAELKKHNFDEDVTKTVLNDLRIALELDPDNQNIPDKLAYWITLERAFKAGSEENTVVSTDNPEVAEARKYTLTPEILEAALERLPAKWKGLFNYVNPDNDDSLYQ